VLAGDGSALEKEPDWEPGTFSEEADGLPPVAGVAGDMVNVVSEV